MNVGVTDGLNGFEHAADPRVTPAQSASNLSRTHLAEYSVPEEQNDHYEEVDRLWQEVCELQAQVLHFFAAAMTAAFWFLIPVPVLSGMYCMTGSAIEPLYLAGIIALSGAMHYWLLNRMLIASAELDFGPDAASPPDKSHSPLNSSKGR
jgi:hypothetical protein